MGTVAIKKVDEQLYRKVKALASLRGSTIGEAVNEALSLWVQLAGRGGSIDKWLELEKESKEDNEIFEKEKQLLLKEHRGQYVAIAHGKIVGTFNSTREAYQVISKENAKHGIVTRIEEKPTKVVDLGWSITEQFV